MSIILWCFTCTKKHILPPRRDKYEHDVKEFWVDVATTGSFEKEDEEALYDKSSVDGTSTTFDLGLPGSDPTAADGDDGPESDGESGDADSDADGAAGSVRSKGSNKAPRIPDMDKEHVFEAPCFYMAASTSIYILLHIYHLIQNHVWNVHQMLSGPGPRKCILCHDEFVEGTV